jgi:hypothetical protein
MQAIQQRVKMIEEALGLALINPSEDDELSLDIVAIKCRLQEIGIGAVLKLPVDGLRLLRKIHTEVSLLLCNKLRKSNG